MGSKYSDDMTCLECETELDSHHTERWIEVWAQKPRALATRKKSLSQSMQSSSAGVAGQQRRRGATPATTGAWEGIRTPDLRITNALLYRLSYPGNNGPKTLDMIPLQSGLPVAVMSLAANAKTARYAKPSGRVVQSSAMGDDSGSRLPDAQRPWTAAPPKRT